MENTKLNLLPVPTFSWLGVNFKEAEIKEYESRIVSVTAEGGKIERISAADGTAYDIAAAVGESSEVVLDIGSGEPLHTEIRADVPDGAVLKLVEVFRGEAQTVAKTTASVGEGASLELIQIYLGGRDTASETVIDLNGRKSSFGANIAYLLGGGDKLDMNLVSNHFGRKSLSQIDVKGVLNGSSSKTFKGTIDFKNGAFGAKGSEKEDVLLLSDDAVNKTVPLILCAEEDVEGNHGASIGRIDEEHIYYMQSRGIPEDKIVALTARSRLARVISLIGDGQTEERIRQIVGWGDDDE